MTVYAFHFYRFIIKKNNSVINFYFSETDFFAYNLIFRYKIQCI